MQSKLRVYLVDDEPLAVSRLTRLLTETGRVEVIGSANEPETALLEIPNHSLDAVFLDIQMPGLTGFELLAKLEKYPPVIFTTAFDEFALQAFEVHSIDYLLKPVEAERLEKALIKLEKLRGGDSSHLADLQKLLVAVNANLDSKPQTTRTLERLPSRIGGRVLLIETSAITHLFSQDKVVFAQNIDGKQFPLDFSITELEKKLDAKFFVRVHRNALVNSNFIEEVHGWFSGSVLIRLKDKRKTEIAVARDRVKILKDFLGM